MDIQFTPRVFPTPMRESKIAEEDDWIAKNRRHLKKHGVLGGNVAKGTGEIEGCRHVDLHMSYPLLLSSCLQ